MELADVGGLEVVRPEMRGSTTFGSALLAGVAIGLFGWDITRSETFARVNTAHSTCLYDVRVLRLIASLIEEARRRRAGDGRRILLVWRYCSRVLLRHGAGIVPTGGRYSTEGMATDEICVCKSVASHLQ